MSKLEKLVNNLQNANQRLREAAQAEYTELNRDATIQRFEFTFELAWKTIQEYARDQGLDCNSPKHCIREAGKLGLVVGADGVERWFGFLESRNLVAHTYNEKIAKQVYEMATQFPDDVEALLRRLSE